MTPETTEKTQGSAKQVQPARRFTMPLVVAGLLGGHIVFIVVAITLATGDRSFAVVPDYYNKAVDHDQHKAQLAESAALGWQLEIKPASVIDAVGRRELVVVLRDAAGQSISDASVSVTCYHLARANQVQTLTLREVLPGQYAAQSDLGKEGFWNFDLTAVRGEERFIAERKQFVRQPEVQR